MTPAYINVVLETFKLKKLENTLLSDLHNPTRANIRKCCLKNCAANYHRKDGQILKDFFGEGDDRELLLQKIKRTDPEDYRTVQNFLQGETSNPREKPVELAAWLIDFTERPYKATVDYNLLLEQTRQAIANILEETGNTGPGGEGTKFPPEPVTPHPPEPPKLPVLNKTWIWVTTSTILAAVTVFLWYNYGEPKLKKEEQYSFVLPKRPVDCMIWVVDHYEQIPCDYRYTDSLAIPLDSVVLRKLKMIIHPELISIEDLDRVWYNKYNNKVEYFTDSGVHPVNKKPLRQLSTHIYTTHIVPLRDSLSRR